jgi:hypothetical protein
MTWFSTDDRALKNPTYILNGINMSQNDEFDASDRILRSNGVFGKEEEAEGAVGGLAGIKKDGMAAIEDCKW